MTQTARHAHSMWIAVAFVGLVLPGCGGSTTPVTPTSNPATQSSSWSGQTSQKTPIGFVVTGTQITSLRFSVSGTVGCSTVSGGFAFTETTGTATISQNAFLFSITNRQLSNGQQLSVVVAGTFASDSSASGTITGTMTGVPDPNCPTATVVVTWTAAPPN